MKFFKIVFGLIISCVCSFETLFAQTNTTTSGTWSDASIWSAGVPGSGAVTANVNHPVEINSNIVIGTSGVGVYNIFQSMTDFPGGTEYTLEINGSGTLDVQGGTTYFGATLGASTTENGSVIRIRNGATLILNGAVEFSNGTSILVEAGGTLIINGAVDNKIQNPSGFVVEGLVQINGQYSSTGGVEVIGNGEFYTTGRINTTGGGTIFGNGNNCDGPCSGNNLCLPENSNVITSSHPPICAGSSTVQLEAGAIANATYEWQSSITSATTGFDSITNTQNFDPGAPTQTTWYRRQATVGSCTGTSPAMAIVVVAGSSWLGQTSDDWNDDSNWCSGVKPTAATDVVINSGVLFSPEVGSAPPAVCRNLTINSGGTLTVNASQTLNVAGNYVNNGTVTVLGAMGFTGTTPQTISGSGFGSYTRINVNNTSAATPALTLPSNGFNITSILQLVAGKVNLSNASLSLGTGSAGSGVIYSSGWLYNGSLTRWIGTGSGTLNASLTGRFPIGTDSDYRPIYFINSSVGTAGTIRVSHTAVTNSSAVSFSDNGTPVQVRSNSFWTVATGNGFASSNNFTVRTEGTGFGTVGLVSDLRLTEVDVAAAGTQATNMGTLSNPQVNRSGIPLADLSTNFYWGSVDASSSPLPIELLNFSATLDRDQVQLQWSTASELNNDYFTIERAVNLEKFEELAILPGNGTTNKVHHYNTVDPSPLYGRSYYRLKQTDFDGKSTYSDVRMIDYEGPAFSAMRVYPNPLSGSALTLVVTGLKEQSAVPVIIYNTQGQVVFEQTYQVENPGTLKKEIELTNHLKSGLYIVKAGPTLQLMQKLIVE